MSENEITDAILDAKAQLCQRCAESEFGAFVYGYGTAIFLLHDGRWAFSIARSPYSSSPSVADLYPDFPDILKGWKFLASGIEIFEITDDGERDSKPVTRWVCYFDDYIKALCLCGEAGYEELKDACEWWGCAIREYMWMGRDDD